MGNDPWPKAGGWPEAPELPRPVIMDQRWTDAVFLHWRIPLAVAAAFMPDGVDPDEFDGSALLGWTRVMDAEGWPEDQLESWDVGLTEAGHLTLMPYSSTWYQDYRGVLLFKEVTGDFAVTADIEPLNRAGDGPPDANYSLAGLMVRAPRSITAETWTSGGESYVFFSVGAADAPGTWQTEVKTTVASRSTLEIESGWPGAELRLARVGSAVVALVRPPGEAWQVHRRYDRSDMPSTLQVGMTVYTDWATCSTRTAAQHNVTQITDGNPDLEARYDYVRFRTPSVPSSLAGTDLVDEATDAELLGFLGTVLD